MKLQLLCLCVGLLAACSTTPPAANETPASTQAAQAAAAPLADLNLLRAEIPAVLQLALKAPYAMPADRACAALVIEVRALDAALGPDLDAPVSENDPSLIERGSGAAGNAALGALRGAAEGVLPFRGWVRKLTGAERHSRAVAAAIVAGTVRRAFLKGLARAQACPPSTNPGQP